ncbi:hypothetical protein FG379_000218 [Cryptosporidium bovis]|uniref:uncharacterized protein n=1 Tax=Cryptosporidium bovis TaxID=310047 RepID=UPI00351AA518|nr:hypothetical protein FG379_000218 [Cryptosporidium bovis]
MLSNFDNGLTEEDLDILLGTSDEEQNRHNNGNYQRDECASYKYDIDDKNKSDDSLILKKYNIPNKDNENSINDSNYHTKIKKRVNVRINKSIKNKNKKTAEKTSKFNKKREKKSINFNIDNDIDSDEFVVPDDEVIPPDWEYNYEKPIVCQNVTFYNRVDSMIDSVKRAKNEEFKVDSGVELYNIEQEYMDDKDNTELILKDRLLMVEDDIECEVIKGKTSGFKLENTSGKNKSNICDLNNCNTLEGNSLELNAYKLGEMTKNIHKLCTNLNLFYNEIKINNLGKFVPLDVSCEKIGEKISHLSLFFKAIDVEFSGLLLPDGKDGKSIEGNGLKSNLNLFFLLLSDLIYDYKKIYIENNNVTVKNAVKREICSHLKETHIDMVKFINSNQENIFLNEKKLDDKFVQTIHLFIRIIGLTLTLESFLVHCIKNFRDSDESKSKVSVEYGLIETYLFTVYDNISNMFNKGTVSKLLRQILAKILDFIIRVYVKNNSLYSSLLLILFINTKLKGTDMFIYINEVLLTEEINAIDSISLYSCLLFCYYGIAENAFNPCIIFPKRLFVEILKKDNYSDQDEFFKLLSCLNEYLAKVNVYIINKKVYLSENDITLYFIEFVLELITFNSTCVSNFIENTISVYTKENSFLNLISNSVKLVFCLKHCKYKNLSNIFVFGHEIINKFIFIYDNFIESKKGCFNSEIGNFLSIVSNKSKQYNLNYLKISFSLFIHVFNVVINSSNFSISLWDKILNRIIGMDFHNICKAEKEDIFSHFIVYSCAFSALCSNCENRSLSLYLLNKYNEEAELIMNYLLTEIVLDEQEDSNLTCDNFGDNNGNSNKRLVCQGNIELLKNLKTIISLLVSDKLNIYSKLDVLDSVVELFETISNLDYDKPKGSELFLIMFASKQTCMPENSEAKNNVHKDCMLFLQILSTIMNYVDVKSEFSSCENKNSECNSENCNCKIDENIIVKLFFFMERVMNLLFNNNSLILLSSYSIGLSIVPKLFELLNKVGNIAIKLSFNLNILHILEEKQGKLFKLISNKLVELKANKENNGFCESLLEPLISKLIIKCLSLVYNFWENFQTKYNIICNNGDCSNVNNNIKLEVYYFILVLNFLVFDDLRYLKKYRSHFKINEKLLFNEFKLNHSTNDCLSIISMKKLNTKKCRLENDKLHIFLLLKKIAKHIGEFYSLTLNLNTEKDFDYYTNLIKNIVVDHILKNWIIDERKDKRLDSKEINVNKTRSEAYIKLFFYYYTYSNDKQFHLYLNKKLIQFPINLYQCETLYGFMLNFYIKGGEAGKDNDVLNWNHISNSIKGMINQLGNDDEVSTWIIHTLFGFFMIPSVLETTFVALRSQIWSNILSIPLSTLLISVNSSNTSESGHTLCNVVKYTYIYFHELYLFILNCYKLNEKNSTFGLTNVEFIPINVSINFIVDLNRLIHLSYFDITLSNITNIRNNCYCDKVCDKNAKTIEPQRQEFNKCSEMFSKLLLTLLLITDILKKAIIESKAESEKHQYKSVSLDIINQLSYLKYYIFEKSILILYNSEIIDNIRKNSLTDKASLFCIQRNCNIEIQSHWINEVININGTFKTELSNNNNNILKYVVRNNGINKNNRIFSRIPVIYKQFLLFKRNKKKIISLSKNEGNSILFCSLSNNCYRSLYNSNLTYTHDSNNSHFYYLLKYIENTIAED